MTADVFPAYDDDGGLLVALSPRVARTRTRDGQRSFTTHRSQRGRARRRRGARARSAGAGTAPSPRAARASIRSRSIFTGSSWRVSPSRCESRRTCVSTTIALRVAELGGDDVRRLARDAGKPQQLVERPRHLAVVLLDQHPHRPAQRLRLLPEEPGREDVALELLHRHGEVVLGSPVLLEQVLGDAVDVHVGRLRREHHRDEQLERRCGTGARSRRPRARPRAAR